MKSGVLMIVSVLLNVALAITLVLVLTEKPRPLPVPRETRTVTNTTVRVVTKRVEAEPTNTTVRLPGNIWRLIESPQYPIYIANLKAIGCPQETICDIIITDINKLYAQKARALHPAAKDNRFWMPDVSGDDPRYREYEKQLRQLEREKRDLVRALLGVDYQAEMAKQSITFSQTDRQLAFLPESKRLQLQELNERFAEMEQEILDQAGGELTAEQKAKLRELRQQKRAALRELLTPAELAEYDARASSTTQELRRRMGAFNATEEEFRTIYRLQREFDEKYNGENSASISPAEREAARKLLEDRLKAELGPERYAEYQRAQDPVYRELYQTAQRNNLPQTKLLEIYDMKRVAEEQRRQLLENQALTPEQKAAGLAALKEETERAIREAMGEQVFRDFQRRGGAWLNNLGSE